MGVGLADDLRLEQPDLALCELGVLERVVDGKDAGHLLERPADRAPLGQHGLHPELEDVLHLEAVAAGVLAVEVRAG